MIVNSIKGCQVFIRDITDDQLIANTKIIDFDKNQVTITVNARDVTSHLSARVSLLVLNDTGILEFQGNIRKNGNPALVSIALFKGRVKEDREARRYPINAAATAMPNVWQDADNTLKPLEVTVLNLSTVGALISAELGVLRPGLEFQLKMHIGSADTSISCIVVRLCESNAENMGQYGCRFTAVN